jgi:SSS family solute:Na+ symporter
VKIPMQLFILFIGALLYVFYIFQPQPLFFNHVETNKVIQGQYKNEYVALEETFVNTQNAKKESTIALVKGLETNDEPLIESATESLNIHNVESDKIRQQARDLIKKNDPNADANDTNYIFLRFVTDYLPQGIIGLLIAVIFAASMSSTSSELNALASTTVVDIYKRSIYKNGNEKHYLKVSKWATVIWGIYAIMVAEFANRLGSLIEAVNILGSLFYGTILGIFLTGFYIKKIKGNAVFMAAIIAEAVVIWCYNYTSISFLWYNLIGCFMVIGMGYLFELIMGKDDAEKKPAD